ncbi:centrosomal protein of 152 kDa-like [Homarus americanus]|uniref:centrosomal protein of 152 kDa-like n=1 Tax=Homarus americanus TaxID=6706 RepID=UPI001C441DBB|nr:centrosomal protein of 152 kDa-like [Homarus americanus]
MDTPGHSLFGGTSLHLQGIGTLNFEDEEQDEEEEENRRKEEIQNMIVNAFDDLEEEESLADQSSHCPLGPDQVHQVAQHLGMEESERSVEMSHVQSGDGHRQRNYSNSQSSITEHYGHEGGADLFPKHRGTDLHSSCSSSQGSVNPWSDDSHEDVLQRHGPFVTEISEGGHHYSGQENLMRNPQQDNFDNRSIYNDEGMSLYVAGESYHADNYKPGFVDDEGSKETLSNQYKEGDIAYDQLKLLYEARGREIDRQMSEISKLKFESSREIRVLQHQLNLLKSEAESKEASVKQLQILLSEKDERVKKMVIDIKESHDKLKAAQDENNKIQFELESAESTISSLECQISELKAADSLARNQQLHENFVRKLQHNNQEEQYLMVTKLQESQKEAETFKQEIKRLRDELKNLRGTYDDALVQKTETVTKLTLTIETVRKQYEELLQAHDGQHILELQLKIRSLESSKQEFETKVRALESEVAKAREDLDGYDIAMKLGLMNDMVPYEDSMVQMGVKKTLNYNDTVTEVRQKKDTQNKLTESQERIKLREELKNSLLINKAKRDEIKVLREETREKQVIIKKAQSDLKEAQIEIKKLCGNLMKLQLEQAECQLRDDDGTKMSVVQAENISLRQELAPLYSSIRQLKLSFKKFNDLIQNWKNDLPNLNSEDNLAAIIERYDKWLQHVESYRNFVSEVEKFSESISQIREENHKLHEGQVLWEKRFHDIQIRLKVSEKMIIDAATDQGRPNEFNQACNILQQLLGNISRLVMVVKEENADVFNEKLNLQDQLTARHLEMEKLRKDIKDLQDDKEDLQLKMLAMSKKNEEEKEAALESCKNTYLEFHKEAVRELEQKIKTDYENIAQNLKGEINRLADQLSRTKELYIRICEEKDEIEDKLKQLEETAELEKSQSQKERQGSSTPTPHSSVGVNSEKTDIMQHVTKYENKIKDLELQIETLKENYKVEKKEILMEKEKLQIKYQQQCEEMETVREASLKALAELQVKCATLEECNVMLNDECRKLEENLLKMKEGNKKPEDVDLNEHGHWQFVLERHQKRVDEEKQELKMYYENLIKELENKYTTPEISKLLKNKMTKQEDDIQLLKNKVKQQEKDIKEITNECGRIKETAEVREHDREQEVRKFTDIVQNLEGQVKEKQDESNNARAAFQKYIQELNEHQALLNQKLKKAEESSAQLQETLAKYNKLKVSYMKFQNEYKIQISYYKEESNRMVSEFATKKEILLDRLRKCIEEVKQMCTSCIDNIISSLKGLDSMQQNMHQAVLELEELSKDIKNLTLTIT